MNLTLPLSFRKYLLFCRHVPRWCWKLGVAVVLAISGITAWLIPVSHHFLALQLGLEPAVVEAVAASPSPDSTGERISNLEKEVDELNKAHNADDATMQQLHDDFQQAISEVSNTNDQLKQQAEMLAELSAGTSPTATNSNASSSTSTSKKSSTPATGKVNINTALATELETLPGIGPTYAQRIIAYRLQHGAFKSVDELDNVSGIGPATLAKLRDLVEI